MHAHYAHIASLEAQIDRALNEPHKVIHELFTAQGLGWHIDEVFNGASPLAMFAGEGEAPAGFLSRMSHPPTIPGTIATTVDGQDVNEIWLELQAMLAAFNQSADAIVAFLSQDITAVQERIGVPHSPGFQVHTEFGRPSKVAVKYVLRGFPLEHYDLGSGHTQEFIDSSTGAQITAVQVTVINSWTELQRELAMSALFGNANFTSKDGVPVKRLYNADGEEPPSIKRWSHDGTHSHYLVAATPTTPVEADLDDMSEHLIHHGFREFADLDVAFLLLAHRTDLPTIRAFTNFIPAAEAEQPAVLTASGVVRGRERGGTGGGGINVEGFVNDWTVVQNNDIPPGYWVGIVTSGAFNGRNVLGRRQHDNDSIRGLRLAEGNRQNYPLFDSVYDGYVGFGVAQRGAAVVLDTQNVSYTPPTFATGE